MSTSSPTSKPRGTCSLCRQRKIRCDGGNPCGGCRRSRTPATCTYGVKVSVPPRCEWLPRGAACVRCREQKRKCNGAVPCSWCTKARPPIQCHYRKPTRAQSKYERTHSTNDSADPSTSLSNLPDPDCSSTDYWSPFCSINSGLDPFAESPLCESPETTNFDLDFMSYFVPAPVITESTVSTSGNSNLCERNPFGDLVPPGARNSLLFPPPHVSLSPAPQPTMDHKNELFSICNRFLHHGWQYGLSLSTPKWNTLYRGDQSGIVVHPTVVNICQLIGCLLTNHLQHHTWVYHTDQTIAEEEQVSLQLIFEFVSAGPGIAPNPVTSLGACVYLATYCVRKGDVNGFEAYIYKGGEVVEQNEVALGLVENLPQLEHRIVGDATYSPHRVEDEGRAAVSQLMFFDMIRTLVLKLPSVLNAALFSKFTRMARKNRTCTDVLFLRSKSAMFLVESQFMVSAWNKSKSSSSVFPTEWSRGYWYLIEDIHTHLNVINSCWTKVYMIPELRTVYPTLKTCMILALTAMVELFGVLAPFLSESRRHHREAVNAVIRIISTFSAADYLFLDPVLAVCWSVAQRPVGKGDAKVDDAEVADRPSETQSAAIGRMSNTMLRQAMPVVID
ncbi:hypothetical protein C8J57DRAFT_164963 [Mycena rebaudengoi]|nr:hypothetical protein C8J57DRAFT_164963 [Mycena rebaudengoi]